MSFNGDRIQPPANAGTNICLWVQNTYGNKKGLALNVEGPSWVSKTHEFKLKMFVSAFGRILLIFTCPRFVMYSNVFRQTSIERFFHVKFWSKQILRQSSGWERLSPSLKYIYYTSVHLISPFFFPELSSWALCRRFDVSATMLGNRHRSTPIPNLTHFVTIL